MKTEFHIGDLVECIEPPIDSHVIKVGWRGTVCDIDNYDEYRPYGVEWERKCGHSCNGACKSCHGWYVPPECIKLVEIPDDECSFSFDPNSLDLLLRP